MMRFRFGQWLRYRRAAKGRHGVHSPFVFHLIENALRPGMAHYPGLPGAVAALVQKREAELLRRLLAYFRPEEWWNALQERQFRLPEERSEGIESSPLPFRRFIYLPSSADAWQSLMNNSEFRLCEDDVLLLSAPHRNPAALVHWQHLQRDSGCTMSLDFLRCGVLLFRKEFKVVQHLVIRFPE